MNNCEKICAEFDKNNIKYERDRCLADCSSFKIGGCAKLAVYPENAAQLALALKLLDELNVRHVLCGNASNLLFDSRGYDGAVVFTTHMKSVTFDGNIIRADCGVPFTKLAIAAQSKGLCGLEFAYGIPGTVGGAVYMNAGAYDGETSMVLKASDYYDPSTGETSTLDKASHNFDYRHSAYMENERIILCADFELAEGNPTEIAAKMEKFITARREKQPLEYPNAGSVFKRYPGYFTAKLIDEAGLKGYRIGGAEVSEKHAGFIVNRGNATSDDVKALVDLITDKIRESHGIEIEREIRYVEYSGVKPI